MKIMMMKEKGMKMSWRMGENEKIARSWKSEKTRRKNWRGKAEGKERGGGT